MSTKRIVEVLGSINPIFLIHTHPVSGEGVETTAEPLAYFNYNRNKRSASFTRNVALNIIPVLEELLATVKTFPKKTHTLNTDIGKIRFSPQYMVFEHTGERYNIPQGDQRHFYTNLIKSLTNFASPNPKGNEYPFYTRDHHINGCREQCMFLVTTHGDHREDAPMSFLRYTEIDDLGKLTLRYGETELFWSSGYIQGMTWVNFISYIHEGLVSLGNNLDKDSINFIFTSHPVLKKYNTYISTMRSFGKVWLTINTDMAPTNNKMMFMVEETNIEHLRAFIGGVKYFLQDKEVV